MNWISNYVRPRINSLFSRRDVPENLWTKCLECGTMLFHRELSQNINVCPNCDHHMNISPRERLISLFDDGIFFIAEIPKPISDPLGFKDQKKYSERMKAAQKKTDSEEAMLVAEGDIGRTKIVVAVQDFSFMGGSMGQYVGESFKIGCLKAIELNCPFIAISSSGGARMQEGLVSLMQLPKTVAAINLLNDNKIPYISLLTNPTTGGVSASFAMLGDIIMAEKGSMIGFAGKRVIEETIKEKLPKDFQTAEYLLDHGMIDIVVHRKELQETLARVLSHLKK